MELLNASLASGELVLQVEFLHMPPTYTYSNVSAYDLYKVGICIFCSLFVYKCYLVAHVCIMFLYIVHRLFPCICTECLLRFCLLTLFFSQFYGNAVQ